MSQRFKAVLLPGGVLPAKLAYPAAVAALGTQADARYKELEIYQTDPPPKGDFLKREVAGIRAFADAAGFDRFHLVGYSAGGASALAFCATHPERLLSLTINEPGWIGGTDPTPIEKAFRQELEHIAELAPERTFPAFIRLNLAPRVEPPPPPEGPPPPWMSQRVTAFPTFVEATRSAEIDHERLGAFQRPVLYTLGGRSHAVYRAMADKLAGVFPDFTLEIFEERHHFDPPHRAEPERFASTLLNHWERAERQLIAQG